MRTRIKLTWRSWITCEALDFWPGQHVAQSRRLPRMITLTEDRRSIR
jgi:hypothetical protein